MESRTRSRGTGKLLRRGPVVQVAGPSSGRPVVLGHGILGDHRLLAPQIAVLARQYRVLAVDFRGHGRSPAPEGSWNLVSFADDFRRVLNEHRVHRAVVGGLSAGAMAALHFALEEPDSVAGLLLIGATAGAEPWSRRLKYEALLTLYGWAGAGAWLRGHVSELAFSPQFRARSEEVVERWADSAAELPPGIVRRAARAVVKRPPLWDRLGGIDVPALVIAGTEDAAIRPAQARRLAEGLPRGRLEMIAGAGHVVTLERPDEVSRVLLDFLGELEDQGAWETG